ncbi:hypothetical protein DFH06DRAFT_1228370, partial [Mycena polygramma]
MERLHLKTWCFFAFSLSHGLQTSPKLLQASCQLPVPGITAPLLFLSSPSSTRFLCGENALFDDAGAKPQSFPLGNGCVERHAQEEFTGEQQERVDLR